MNKLWIFGCSFSSGYDEIPMNKSYGNLLSEELGYEIKNLSCIGNSNDKIIYDLINNLENINTGDIIIFQYTTFDRIGFYMNDQTYFSTSGFVEFGVKNKNVNVKKIFTDKNIDLKKMEILVDYILNWQTHRKKFDLENSLNILNYLNTTKNIQYYTLYMNDEYIHINKNTIFLPIISNENNVSMIKFITDWKLSISDEYPKEHSNFYDTHPGYSGHEKIKEIILKKIKENSIKDTN